MFTIEQIHDIHSRLGTRERFPEYVRALNAIGVETYDSYVTDGHSEYFSSDGAGVGSEPVHPVIEISSTSDESAVVEHLRLHEQGKTTYMELSKGLAESGVERWTVDTNAMTIAFVDKRGVALVTNPITG